MQVSKSVQGATKVTLGISGGPADLEPIRRHVLGHFVRQVRVPGFRAGKAPLDLVEKHVNQKLFLDEFLEHALNDLYRRVIETENIRPGGMPEVQIKKFVPFTDLEFEATLETIGEIKLTDYKKIKLAKPKVSVTAKDVSGVLESLRTRSAERLEVNRPSKNGDELIIDFVGKDSGGKPVPGADGKDYPLILGSNTFIPGFEDHLAGLKATQSKEFTLTFPGDYGVKTLQNRKVTFKVEVKKINELKAPKLDDTFASTVGPFQNLAQLKADIKKQLLAERQARVDNDYANQLIQKITQKTDVQIPDSLIQEHTIRLEDEEKQNLVYRNQTWQEHLEIEGVIEQEHRTRHRPDAEARVKASLVLSEIANKEGIQVTLGELSEQLQILKGQYQDPAMQAELDKPQNQQEIANRILTEKTIQKIVGYASK